jgi:hypothetical protein
MVQPSNAKREEPQENALKTNRSVLGLANMNASSVLVKPLKKESGEPSKKQPVDKENLTLLSFLKGESRLKKKKLTVISKPSQAKPFLVKAVAVVESEDEECF